MIIGSSFFVIGTKCFLLEGDIMYSPAGTIVYIKKTINHLLVGKTSSSFSYFFDCSSLLSTGMKSSISGSENILVWDVDRQITVPRVVKYNSSLNKLLVFFNAPISVDVDLIYCICFGPTLSVEDDVDAFTGYGIQNRWGFDEFTNSDTTVDDVGGYVMSKTGSVTLGGTGKFGNASRTENNVSYLQTTNQVVGSGNKSFSFLVNFDDVNTNRWVCYNGTFGLLFQPGDPYGTIYVYVSGSGSQYADFPVLSGQWSHVVVTISSGGVLSIYCDNSPIVSNIQFVPLSDGTVNLAIAGGGAAVEVYNMVGKLDEFLIFNYVLAAGDVTNIYQMITNSSFSSSEIIAIPSDEIIDYDTNKTKIINVSQYIDNYYNAIFDDIHISGIHLDTDGYVTFYGKGYSEVDAQTVKLSSGIWHNIPGIYCICSNGTDKNIGIHVKV